MNDDRCYHIPMSPGQKMCTCEDHRIMLESIIQMQARFIDVLMRRFEKGEVTLYFNDEEL